MLVILVVFNYLESTMVNLTWPVLVDKTRVQLTICCFRPAAWQIWCNVKTSNINIATSNMDSCALIYPDLLLVSVFTLPNRTRYWVKMSSCNTQSTNRLFADRQQIHVVRPNNHNCGLWPDPIPCSIGKWLITATKVHIWLACFLSLQNRVKW